jgi:hypothetical protein
MLEICPAERMNAYPISQDIELPGRFTTDILKPAGERINTEAEQKFIRHRQWGQQRVDLAELKK